jgi:hypothetical protein
LTSLFTASSHLHSITASSPKRAAWATDGDGLNINNNNHALHFHFQRFSPPSPGRHSRSHLRARSQSISSQSTDERDGVGKAAVPSSRKLYDDDTANAWIFGCNEQQQSSRFPLYYKWTFPFKIEINYAEIAIGDEVECGDGLMVVEEEEEEEDQEKGGKEAEEQANMDADEAAAEEASNADDEPAHFQQPLCEKTLQEEEMVLEVKPAGKTAKWFGFYCWQGIIEKCIQFQVQKWAGAGAAHRQVVPQRSRAESGRSAGDAG